MNAEAREITRIERRTQAQRRAESEHAILQAAAELFAERGYVDTTMEQIGTRAGFSAALIARKFGSKPGVIEALLETIRRNTTAMTNPDGQGDVVEVVRRYVSAIADGNVWSRALYVLMAESVGPLRDKADLFARHNASFIAALASAIKKAQRKGTANPKVKARMLAAELVARIRGITLLWLIDPNGIDFHGMTKRLIGELQQTLNGGEQ